MYNLTVLRQCSRTNRITKINNELKEEKRRKEGKERKENGRIREKEIEERGRGM